MARCGPRANPITRPACRRYRLVAEHTVDEQILSRSEKKLYLDAMIMKAGRGSTGDGGSGNRQELLDTIRFGSDRVFKTEDTITDEDIDVIIGRGQHKTAQAARRLQSECQHTLGSFSMTDEGGYSHDQFRKSFFDQAADEMNPPDGAADPPEEEAAAAGEDPLPEPEGEGEAAFQSSEAGSADPAATAAHDDGQLLAVHAIFKSNRACLRSLPWMTEIKQRVAEFKAALAEQTGFVFPTFPTATARSKTAPGSGEASADLTLAGKAVVAQLRARGLLYELPGLAGLSPPHWQKARLALQQLGTPPVSPSRTCCPCQSAPGCPSHLCHVPGSR